MTTDNDYTTQELEKREVEWLVERRVELECYLEEKSGRKIQDVPTPAVLETYFQEALTEQKAGLLDEDFIINMFAVGLGQYLIENAGYQWVYYSDRFGSELAIENIDNNKLGFPFFDTALRITDTSSPDFKKMADDLTCDE